MCWECFWPLNWTAPVKASLLVRLLILLAACLYQLGNLPECLSSISSGMYTGKALIQKGSSFKSRYFLVGQVHGMKRSNLNCVLPNTFTGLIIMYTLLVLGLIWFVSCISLDSLKDILSFPNIALWDWDLVTVEDIYSCFQIVYTLLWL